ncbi:MAG TPA: peptidoglycan DD-metalloendopeptidase family protein [Acidimicrobiales bacterium]|nr:peptidoglycan DD-metalloendopeptidase family protein [Acidimicrobiales bacterium]
MSVRRARAAAIAAIIVCCLLAEPLPAAAAEAVAYQAPVPEQPVERFRPPQSAYGAGNRGVDYETEPGQAVHAAAPGVVAFAGQVGGSLHVTILHADGIRTSYSFLASTSVRRGARVAAGQEVGRAGPRLHWGARAGDAYVDPTLLVGDAGGTLRAKLVPDGERDGRPRSEAQERSLLAGLLRTVVRTGATVARSASATLAWARDRPLDLLLNELGRMAARDPVLRVWVDTTNLSSSDWTAVAAQLKETATAAEPCTARSVAPPPRAERRIALLVGGLGSSSASAAVTTVDTAALGYAGGDVHQFSYRGGTAAERPYEGRDTQGDIPTAGQRLRDLLHGLVEAHPGVPVDVIAHSQGGIVARLALADGAPPGVASLVTLGSPHHGADIAQLAAEHRRTLGGRALQDAVFAANVSPIDGSAPAVRQLARGSSMLADLNRRPPPAGVHVVSVAGRADIVVPPPRSRVPGGHTVTVTPHGLHHHDTLPASAAAAREIRLATAGMPPTCRSSRDSVLDAITARLLVAAEQAPRLALAARRPPSRRRG